MITATANLGSTITATAELKSVQVGSCLDATVHNSNNSYSTTVASGGDLPLPNIDFTDSTGVTTSVPSMEDIVATPIPPCADATVTVNSTPYGTAPSGGSENVEVVSGVMGTTPRGSLIGGKWFIAYSPFQINGVNRDSLPPETTFNLTVRLNGVEDSGSYNAATDTLDITSSFGTRILTVLSRQFDIQARFAISLRVLYDAYVALPVIRVRRSGDNAERDTLASEIIDGTLVAWVIAGGGTTEGFISKYYDQSGNVYSLGINSAALQDCIVKTGGVLVVDSYGKPAAEVRSATANFRLTRFAINTTASALGLSGASGSIWIVAKRGVSADTKMLDRSGNPFIGSANAGGGRPDSSAGGTAVYTVNGTVLAPVTPAALQTATQGIQAATIINTIGFSGTSIWGSQSLGVFNMFPVGSLISEFVLFNISAASQQALIQTDLNSYYGYP